MGVKVPYSIIKQRVTDKGYRLITPESEYIDTKHKVELWCSKHGKFKSTINNLRHHECPHCGAENGAKFTRHSIEFVRDFFKKCGMKLVSKEYVKNSDKLDAICPKHGLVSIRFGDLIHSKQCPKCGKEAAGDKEKICFDVVKDEFEKRGRILVSTEYHNNKEPLDYICIKHKEKGIQHQGYKAMMSGEKCHWCAIEGNSGKNHPNWKGGCTETLLALRQTLVPWRTKQFIRTGRKCEITGKTGDIVVHHMVSFRSILDKTLSDLNMELKPHLSDYKNEELRNLMESLVRNNEVMAKPIVMLRRVHERFHSFCGGSHKPTSFAQLEQFKKILKDEQNLNEKAG